jgi:hypothetical protein
MPAPAPAAAALAATLFLLGGCAGDAVPSPSLLPRAIETQSLAAPELPEVAATPDAALDRQAAEATAALGRAETAFAAASRDAEAKVAVARGVAEGSERWLDAQAALSGLEALRAPTLTLLADLERSVLDRAQAGVAPYPAIEAAAAAADRQATEQGDRILALEAALAGA